jgi:hypothetical protein
VLATQFAKLKSSQNPSSFLEKPFLQILQVPFSTVEKQFSSPVGSATQ